MDRDALGDIRLPCVIFYMWGTPVSHRSLKTWGYLATSNHQNYLSHFKVVSVCVCVCLHAVVLWVGNMDRGQDLGCIQVTRTERTVLLPLAMEARDSGTRLLYETKWLWRPSCYQSIASHASHMFPSDRDLCAPSPDHLGSGSQATGSGVSGFQVAVETHC